MRATRRAIDSLLRFTSVLVLLGVGMMILALTGCTSSAVTSAAASTTPGTPSEATATTTAEQNALQTATDVQTLWLHQNDPSYQPANQTEASILNSLGIAQSQKTLHNYLPSSRGNQTEFGIPSTILGRWSVQSSGVTGTRVLFALPSSNQSLSFMEITYGAWKYNLKNEVQIYNAGHYQDSGAQSGGLVDTIPAPDVLIDDRLKPSTLTYADFTGASDQASAQYFDNIDSSIVPMDQLSLWLLNKGTQPVTLYSKDPASLSTSIYIRSTAIALIFG